VLSRTDFLRLVEGLISRGQLDEAKRLVGDLPEDGPLATDRLFLSAKIAEAEGDYLATTKTVVREMQIVRSDVTTSEALSALNIARRS
jgi:hypothetical protein